MQQWKTNSFRKIQLHWSMCPSSTKIRSTCLQTDRIRAEISTNNCMITSQPFAYLKALAKITFRWISFSDYWRGIGNSNISGFWPSRDKDVSGSSSSPPPMSSFLYGEPVSKFGLDNCFTFEMSSWPDSEARLSFLLPGTAHRLYTHFLLLLWVLWCLVNLSLRQNAMEHKSHLYGLISACVLEWRFSSAFEKNDL